MLMDMLGHLWDCKGGIKQRLISVKARDLPLGKIQVECDPEFPLVQTLNIKSNFRGKLCEYRDSE